MPLGIGICGMRPVGKGIVLEGFMEMLGFVGFDDGVDMTDGVQLIPPMQLKVGTTVIVVEGGMLPPIKARNAFVKSYVD